MFLSKREAGGEGGNTDRIGTKRKKKINELSQSTSLFCARNRSLSPLLTRPCFILVLFVHIDEIYIKSSQKTRKNDDITIIFSNSFSIDFLDVEVQKMI